MPSSLTPEQRSAVEAPASVAVTAGAGTGKTHMLTERYVHHVRVDGLAPLQIVAATFTDRAAAELRSRIRARLRDVGASPDQTAELEAAQIGTLHALAGRICREHPEAADAPYDFVLQEPIQQRLWRERRFAEALDALPPDVARGVPYGTLVGVLRALLEDVHTAERALAVDPATWPDLVEEERERVFGRLAATASWREAVETLRSHEGPAGDKMEVQRAEAVAAIASFEAGRFGPAACEALDSLNAGRGSKKAWGESALQALKAACVSVRETYREGAYAFALELGEADRILERALGGVRDAFESVRDHLAARKREERVLDFQDLELHALRALRDPEVVAFYADRWKAFLIDEFQDTNPVQAALLEQLTREASVTVVGDEKQSIYGFRRADVDVFRSVRSNIDERGGKVVELAQSFRTHAALVERTNAVVRPALGALHQPLTAARAEPPGAGPFVHVHLMEYERGVTKPFRQRAEAFRIGEIVEHALLGAGALVHDKRGNASRPVRPGDIAILARTWNDLGPFADELAARGIPAIHAGGGDLFGQREVKDGLALLRFLADPSDDIALAAVLRSPFFGVSDPVLAGVASRVGQRIRAAAGEDRPVAWWHVLRGDAAPDAEPGSLAHAVAELADLLGRVVELLPSELLAAADDRTGYTAAIANLPGGPRRLADWRGLVDVVATLEGGRRHALAVVRELNALVELEGSSVPRPALEAGDAVSLMTVHNAKGLEWPVVILPDLTGRGGGGGVDAVFEADVGAAFKVRDTSGDEVEPALFQILKARAKQREAEEEMRVLYVALTRARDRLYLTANEPSGGALDAIAPGLAEAGIDPNVEPYEPDRAVPRTPRPPSADRAGTLLLDPAGSGLTHVDATSLSAYAVCPKRFAYEVLDGHPGAPIRPEAARWLREHKGGRAAGDRAVVGSDVTGVDPAARIRAAVGPRVGARVGGLSHRALEREIRDVDALAAYDDTLERDRVAYALELADVYRRHEAFADVRARTVRGVEVRGTVRIDGSEAPAGVVPPRTASPLTVHAVADVLGGGYVLDYKTGEPEVEAAHDLQLAVYARAFDAREAYIAYLRTPAEGGPTLDRLDSERLEQAHGRAAVAVRGIQAGAFDATPGEERCASCGFEAICTSSALRTRT